MKNPIFRNNFACFSAMFLWAIGFPAVDVLVESWGALTLVFLRFFITAIILFPFWFIIEGAKAFKNLPLFRALSIGFFGWGIGAILLLIGQKLSDPVTPTICAAMMPIFGTIVEVIFDKRQLKLNLIIGILFAIIGGYLATGVNISDGHFGSGAIICIISVLLFAWCTRASTKGLQSLSYIGQTTLTMTGGMIAALFIYLCSFMFNFGEINVGHLDQYHLTLLFIFILVSQTISQTVWIWGSGKLGVLLASFHSNAVPFYVMIIMVILFGENWNWLQAIGAFIVGLGVVIAQNTKWGDLTKNNKTI